MTRPHLCLLGCGLIAARHGRTLRAVERSLPLFFASRSREKAEAYRRRFGGVAAFGSYEQGCAAPEVDAVIICTPHAHHLEHARLAASHGKHLLIEKPLARSVAEADAIIGVVRAAGVRAMVAENYHFKPSLRILLAHLGAQAIGGLRVIEVTKAAPSAPGGWRADTEMMGGGALLEGGVHWVHLMTELGGPVEAVLAVAPEREPSAPTPLEDTLEVVLRYRSGAVGKLLHSWALPNRLRGLSLSKVYGTAGTITFESNGLFVCLDGRRFSLRFPGLRDVAGFRAMMRAFLRVVADGEAPAMSLERARDDLVVVEAAYRSLRTGRLEATGER